MKKGQRRPFWPYLCVVACLFILTVLAPMTWLRDSQDQSERTTLRQSVDIEFMPLPGSRSPDSQSPDSQSPDSQTPDSQTPDSQTEQKDSASNNSQAMPQEDPLPLPPLAPALRLSDSPEPLSLDGNNDRERGVAHDVTMVELASDTQPELEVAPEPPPIPRASNNSLTQSVPSVAKLQPGVGARIEPIGISDMRRLPQVNQLAANPTIPNGINYPNTGFLVPPALPKPDGVPAGPAVETPKAEPTANPCVRPAGLVRQLEGLSQHDEARAIALEILTEVQTLAARPTMAEDEVPRQLYKLDAQIGQLEKMAERAESLRLKSDLKRTIYAIRRRVIIWDRAHQLLRTQNYASIDSPNVQRLKEAVAVANERFSVSRFQSQWRGYLGLDPIESLIYGDLSAESIGKIRALSAVSLLRIESPMLNDFQKQLMSSREFVGLADALRPWATQPVDVEKLLYHLESYEVRGGSSSGERVSQNYHWLRWSGREADEQFATELNTHYRNANIRIAVSKHLVNRLMPGNEVYTEPVQDTILGANVRGHSTTSNKVGIDLHPDSHKWRMKIEAIGQVVSNTRSSRGPATFYNRGNASFHAEREISVTPQGLQLHESHVGAYTGSDLHDVETDLDSVPLIGMFARAIAVQQHDSRIAQADREMRRKVARRVQAKFDSEVNKRVDEATQQFHSKIYDPLKTLNVDPVAIDMKTTADRIIARYRIAAPNQLAANTPRPLAPSDSLISAQIHQSSMNNVLQNLELDGKRMGLNEIFEKIGRMFPQTPMKVNEELPSHVTVEFAKYDAVRVQCDDGAVTITLKIQELKSGRQSWDKFIVRANYRPDSNGLDANLVREGYIELLGKRLRLVDQAALRGIFGKVFDKERKLPLISEQIAEHPKMRDSELTQCVMQDGWIGIAIGPKRPAVIGSRTVILK